LPEPRSSGGADERMIAFMLLPLAHMLIILVAGAAGFYLMHVFAR